ncbi:MAG: HAMP domain-containing histidine kinase [Victivallales bacterium]|nr:HAMP domain-containing histidine kinase [Victivallales bacterium]
MIQKKTYSFFPAARKKEIALTLLMLVLLVFFAVWQVSDHLRLQGDHVRILSLLKRDIGNAIAGVLNSQPRFGAIVVESYVRGRLESLMDVEKESPLRGVALLNDGDELIMKVDIGLPELWYECAGGLSSGYVLVSGNYSKVAAAAGYDGVNPVVGDQNTILSVINLVSASSQEPLPPGGSQTADKVKSLLSEDFLKSRSVAEIIYAVDVGFLNDAVAKDFYLRTGSLLFCFIAFSVFLVSLFNLNRNARLSVQLAAEREKNERACELQLLAAGLAHEIKNPLNLVRGITQTISEALGKDDGMRGKIATVAGEVDRISNRLNSFLAYSSMPESSPVEVDLRRMVDDISTLLAPDIEAKDIQFCNDVEVVRLLADEDALRQILFNLAHNATKAVGLAGHVDVCDGMEGRGKIWIEVSDNGPGVAEQYREDIFKPYFSIGSSGTGLGLALARHLASANGWTLRYVPRDGCGAVFRLEGVKCL